MFHPNLTFCLFLPQNRSSMKKKKSALMNCWKGTKPKLATREYC